MQLKRTGNLIYFISSKVTDIIPADSSVSLLSQDITFNIKNRRTVSISYPKFDSVIDQNGIETNVNSTAELLSAVENILA